jgi:hypothetical protein
MDMYIYTYLHFKFAIGDHRWIFKCACVQVLDLSNVSNVYIMCICAFVVFVTILWTNPTKVRNHGTLPCHPLLYSQPVSVPLAYHQHTISVPLVYH